MIAKNNPFNIRYNALNRWLGLSGQRKGFCEFEEMDYGLRAGFILLRNYIYNLKLTSVNKIISRFAPTNENDTSAYIRFVSGVLVDNGFAPSYLYNTLDLSYDKAFFYLCKAILKMENNYALTYMDFVLICRKFNLHKHVSISDENIEEA